MQRRGVVAGLILMAVPGVVRAEDLADEVVRALQRQGYSRIRVGRTFLGRTRITASSPKRKREIILNPRTGEILRDYWEDADGASGISVIDIEEDDDHSRGGSGDDSGSSGSGSSGSGSSGSGSDDHGGDDSSGHGGGSDDGGSDGGGSDDGGSDDGGSDSSGSDGGGHGRGRGGDDD